MPIATPAQYAAMLDAAQEGNYAYPAMNVTSLTTINGALKAFADKKSDGIIQVSTGGGEFASGLDQKDAVLGAIILAEATHRLAERYDVLIALHTDHCQPGKVDSFLKPLIAETARRREAGLPNLFQSHMLDASELPLKQNLELSADLLKLCAAVKRMVSITPISQPTSCILLQTIWLLFTKLSTVWVVICSLRHSATYMAAINRVPSNCVRKF